MSDRQLLVPDGSVGHDERCEAPRPGTDRPCRCADIVGVW